MELNTKINSSVATAYGRACMTCARAKAKCVVNLANGTPGTKCERCHRLNKSCEPSEAVRKRKNADKLPETKVARLEEKLDGLLTLLKSNSDTTVEGLEEIKNGPNLEQLTPESLQHSITTPENSGPRDSLPIESEQELAVKHCSDLVNHGSVHPVGPDTSYTATGTRSTMHHSPAVLSSGLEPSSEEAEQLLDVYKSLMMQDFPITIVPSSTNAQQLRQQCPILWLCIMSLCSKSLEQQKALAREIRLSVSREALLEGRYNLDLVLGLTTYVAWGHFYIFDKLVITSFMQLAIGQLTSLGLHKPEIKEPPHMMLNFDGNGCPRPLVFHERTIEERRTALSCFLVSSFVSCYFQRTESPRWTPYLEGCLEVLAEHIETPSDMLLIQFVRLRLIVEKVAQAPWWHDASLDSNGFRHAPAQFYIKALTSQLENTKSKIPPELSQNTTLRLHVLSTELTIHEVGLSKASCVTNDPDFQRLERLWTCLNAIKDWFENFLTFSPSQCFGVSMAVLTQMSHCIIALYRLSTFDHADWDRAMVRSTLDLSLVLTQVISKLAQVKTAMMLSSETPDDKDIFSITCHTLQSIKTWWEYRLAAEQQASQGNDMTGEIQMDWLDDAWFQDTFVTGQYGFEPFMQ